MIIVNTRIVDSLSIEKQTFKLDFKTPFCSLVVIYFQKFFKTEKNPFVLLIFVSVESYDRCCVPFFRDRVVLSHAITEEMQIMVQW